MEKSNSPLAHKINDLNHCQWAPLIKDQNLIPCYRLYKGEKVGKCMLYTAYCFSIPPLNDFPFPWLNFFQLVPWKKRTPLTHDREEKKKINQPTIQLIPDELVRPAVARSRARAHFVVLASRLLSHRPAPRAASQVLCVWTRSNSLPFHSPSPSFICTETVCSRPVAKCLITWPTVIYIFHLLIFISPVYFVAFALGAGDVCAGGRLLPTAGSKT